MRTISTALALIIICSCKTKSKNHNSISNNFQQPLAYTDTCSSTRDSVFQLLYWDYQKNLSTHYYIDSIIPKYKNCIMQMDSVEILSDFLKISKTSVLKNGMEIGKSSVSYTMRVSAKISIIHKGKRYEDGTYNNSKGLYYIDVEFDPITRKLRDIRVEFKRSTEFIENDDIKKLDGK